MAGGFRGVTRLRRVAIGAIGLDGGDAAGDEGEDEEHGGAAEHDPEPPDQSGLRACSLGCAPLLGVGGRTCGGEEVALGAGESGLGA